MEMFDALALAVLAKANRTDSIRRRNDTCKGNSSGNTIKKDKIQLELDENASQEERSKLLLEFQHRYSIYLNLCPFMFHGI
jgi:hypothetical protein